MRPPAPEAQASLAGTWSVRAECPLWITVTGTTWLTWSSAGRYAGRQTNSLGDSATGEVWETGGNTVSGRFRWASGVTETISGRLSADRRTLWGKSSRGCSFTSTKRG